MSYSQSFLSLDPAPCWVKGKVWEASVVTDRHWKFLCLLSGRHNARCYVGWGNHSHCTEGFFGKSRSCCPDLGKESLGDKPAYVMLVFSPELMGRGCGAPPHPGWVQQEVVGGKGLQRGKKWERLKRDTMYLRKWPTALQTTSLPFSLP